MKATPEPEVPPGWSEGLQPLSPEPGWREALAADPLERWWSEQLRRVFVSRDGSPLALPSWPAYRALVVERYTIPDLEGPDFLLSLVFCAGGRWLRLRLRFGYDTLHWAMSSPEHLGWFEARLGSVGQTVTVLCDGTQATVFGQHEPFVECSLAQMVAWAQASQEERAIWMDEALDLLQAERGRPGNERRVATEAARLGVAPEDLVKELARRRRLNEPVWPSLERLAPVMGEAMHRVWAAD